MTSLCFKVQRVTFGLICDFHFVRSLLLHIELTNTHKHTHIHVKSYIAIKYGSILNFYQYENVVHTHTHTHVHLSRVSLTILKRAVTCWPRTNMLTATQLDARNTLTRETVPAFGWQCFRLSNYVWTWAQSPLWIRRCLEWGIFTERRVSFCQRWTNLNISFTFTSALWFAQIFWRKSRALALWIWPLIFNSNDGSKNAHAISCTHMWNLQQLWKMCQRLCSRVCSGL